MKPVKLKPRIKDDEYTMSGPEGRARGSTALERREFLKLAGGGLVVFFAVGEGLDAAGGRTARRRRLSRRPQRLSQGRPGRPGDLFHRQDRDGPGHHHLAGDDAGRGARRPARLGRHGHGRHGHLPLRRGHLRVAQHEVFRAAHAAGRGRGAGRPRPAGLGPARRGRGGAWRPRTARSTSPRRRRKK